MVRSRGLCEICGKSASCSDVPSRYLVELAGTRAEVDVVAAVLHEAWREWARKLLDDEPEISGERRAGLETLVQLDYAQLHPYGQEKAREWARAVLEALRLAKEESGRSRS